MSSFNVAIVMILAMIAVAGWAWSGSRAARIDELTREPRRDDAQDTPIP